MIKLPLKPFYFLRHGETDWNFEYKAIGSQDVQLNERGLSQALIAGELLQNEPIGTIVSSPLLRARKTADIISKYVKAPVIEVTELQEACWGEKEGTLKGNGLWIKAWRGGYEIKHSEKYLDFAERVKLGIEKALKYNGPVLIISHGGVYGVVQACQLLILVIVSQLFIGHHRHHIQVIHGLFIFYLKGRISTNTNNITSNISATQECHLYRS